MDLFDDLICLPPVTSSRIIVSNLATRKCQCSVTTVASIMQRDLYYRGGVEDQEQHHLTEDDPRVNNR